MRKRDGKSDPPGESDRAATLRHKADDAWNKSQDIWEHLKGLHADAPEGALNDIENRWERLDRDVDEIQRELISERSFHVGVRTVAWLTIVTLALVLLYLITHGVRSLDFSSFEPWPEWGPMEYGEVAFWGSFGALCYLLFLASYYLLRRDFDEWYQSWYVTTALRAPFMTVILMMVVLEFVEWYGQGKWIQQYILEEGNKFYFIVLVSFCLGLSSDSTAAIMRNLSGGVTAFVSRAAGRVSKKLGSSVSEVDAAKK